MFTIGRSASLGGIKKPTWGLIAENANRLHHRNAYTLLFFIYILLVNKKIRSHFIFRKLYDLKKTSCSAKEMNKRIKPNQDLFECPKLHVL